MYADPKTDGSVVAEHSNDSRSSACCTGRELYLDSTAGASRKEQSARIRLGKVAAIYSRNRRCADHQWKRALIDEHSLPAITGGTDRLIAERQDRGG